MVSLAVENLLELKCLAFLFYQPTAVTAALGGYVWIWDMGGYVWRSFAGKKNDITVNLCPTYLGTY